MNLRDMERLARPIESPSYRLSPKEKRRLPDNVKDWLRMSELAGMDAPKMAFGPFRQMLDGAIMLNNQTDITGTAETAMFSVAQYSGFAANQLRAGQIWHLTAFGVCDTPGASQGNITITPRFGTSTSGTSLGASAATALAASATNAPWRLEYDLVVRDVGNAGANSAVAGSGMFNAAVALIAASTGPSFVFGSTADVSVDLSVASGLFIGVTMGHASDAMTTMGVMLESLN
jgi:hypothetical protein